LKSNGKIGLVAAQMGRALSNLLIPTVLFFMAYKDDVLYFGERLKDPRLLEQAVKIHLGKDRFLCVPCGGDRVTGFTHFFKTKTEASIVYRTLADSGGDFPALRILPVVNVLGEDMFMVKWGMDEPDRRLFYGWEYEIAIAKQLGYTDECMEAHRERFKKFYGASYEW
jgi:hypothetical protein